MRDCHILTISRIYSMLNVLLAVWTLENNWTEVEIWFNISWVSTNIWELFYLLSRTENLQCRHYIFLFPSEPYSTNMQAEHTILLMVFRDQNLNTCFTLKGAGIKGQQVRSQLAQRREGGVWLSWQGWRGSENQYVKFWKMMEQHQKAGYCLIMG